MRKLWLDLLYILHLHFLIINEYDSKGDAAGCAAAPFLQKFRLAIDILYYMLYNILTKSKGKVVS